jgi:hypothetical protein
MTQPAATSVSDPRAPVPAAPAPAEPTATCQVCGTPAAAPQDSIFCRACGEPVIVCGWAP